MFSVLIASLLVASGEARMLPEAQRSELDHMRKLFGPDDVDFCDSPTPKERVVFPDSLVGRADVNFDMYSGYLNISTAPDYLFYWFFGTQDGNENAPLVIWTNGGPGCTAMEGATTEHGPLSLFDIKESCSGPQCDYSGQLSTNPYAWNAHANVLYLDQPKNVGYSFGYGDQPKSSQEAAKDVVIFYNEFLTHYPEFVGREVVIAGESYGGKYIPAWADAILNFNEEASEADQINLSGVIIGNGCVNTTVQNADTFIEFQHNSNLIPADSTPRNKAAAQAEMVDFIGYSPNYYDYRIESISCPACYSYNYTAWSAWFLRDDVKEALHICGDAGVDAFAGTAGGCISMGAYDVGDDFDYSGALGRALNAGIPVSVYYGKTDTACDYVGGKAMADTIAWNEEEAFRTQALEPMVVVGSTMGYSKTDPTGLLTYYEIESAGHMVPMDQPVGTAVVINDMLAKVQA